LIDVLAAGDGPGIATEQDAEAVLLLGNRFFDRRDAGQRFVVLRLVLAQFERRDDAAE
jgi:hypothetical protein